MDAGLIAMRMHLGGGEQVAAEAAKGDAAIEKNAATVEAANKRVARSNTGIRSSLMKQVSTMRSIGRGLTKYITLPVLGVAAVSGKMALDFDRNMRNVNSIAQLPEASFNRLKQQVLDLAGPTAQSPNTLAEGLYDLVSSGFKADEAISILHKSALAASAGLTTTEVSTKAVAAALNAYHLPASKAGQVSDQLFETVNRGVLTFDQLATSIGDALPFASQLGVGLDQVGAAISTMTKQGLSAPEAVTRLKNVMVTMIKPGKALNDALNSMNTSGAALVKEKGLQGALEAVIGTTNGSKAAIAALFPNIRALGGVLSLTGKSAKSAHEDLNAFKNTTGATAQVLHEQEKSFGFQMQRAWASLQAVLIEIGQEVLPIVIPPFLHLVGIVRDGIKWFAGLPGPIKQVGGGLIIMAALAGPLLLLAGSIASTAVALAALGVTLAGVAIATGIGAAIIAIGVAFYLAYTKVKWFRDGVDAVVGFVKDHWKLVGPLLIAPFLPFIAVVAAVVLNFGRLKDAAQAVGAFLTGSLGAAMQWAGNALHNVGDFFSRLPGVVGDALAKVPGLIWAGLRQTPHLLGRFIGFFLALPFRIGYIFVKLQIKIATTLAHLIARLPGLAIRAVTALVNGFVQVAPQVIAFWTKLNLKILTFMATLPVKIAQVGIKVVLGFVRGLVSAAPKIWGWVKSLPGKFVSAIASIAPQLVAVGKSIASEIASGLKQGLSDMLPGPVKNALGAAGGVASEVGGFLGFASGTTFAPGGWSLVGERGPELVNLTRGAEVLSTSRTMPILRGEREPGRAPGRAPKAKSQPEARRSAALARFGVGGGSGPKEIRVPVYLNKRKIAEAVADTFDDEDARK